MDEANRPVAQARALDETGRLLGYSNIAGRFPRLRTELAVRIERIGYQPSEVASTEGLRPCVVLHPLSYSLPAVVIADARSPTLAQTITRETARRAPALGEPDIFRVLPLAGAVTQVNDLRAAVHLAGGATDETGVTLDGHPLQWPFHAASALSAFNVSALDRADVAIHQLAVEENDWLAGRIALIPRAVLAGERVREVDVSLLSTTATLGTRVPGNMTVVASGRLTYLGAVLKRIAPGQGEVAPTYRDAMVRLAKGDSSGWSASLLAYATLDERSAAAEADGHTRWGERLGGFATQYAGARWSWRARISVDEATVDERRNVASQVQGPGGLDTAEPQYVALTQRWISASSAATWFGASTWSVSAGASLDRRENLWDWNSQNARTVLAPRAPFISASSRDQTRSALFTESKYAFPRGVQFTAGVRATAIEGATYTAPRATLEAQLSISTRLAISAERRFQLDAVPEELREGGLLPPVALLAKPRRMDAISLSAVHQRSNASAFRRSLRGAIFLRRYGDRPILVAPPVAEDDNWPYSALDASTATSGGLTVTSEFVRAHGLALQGTYTFQQVRERYAGLTSPTAWDAPHHVSLFAALPFGSHWTASVVGQLHSGAAYTPIEARLLLPSLTTSPSYSARLLLGERNATRLPVYHRIDVGVRRTWSHGRTEWGLGAHIINVLNRTNLLTYDWDLYVACGSGNGCGRAFGERSLPLIPSLALQVKW